MLEEVLTRYSETKLHKNHLLLIGVREKIILALVRRRKGLQLVLSQKSSNMTHDQEKRVKEALVIALKKQIYHFRNVASVMEKLDFPKEFWDKQLQKMIREEEDLYKEEH